MCARSVLQPVSPICGMISPVVPPLPVPLPPPQALALATVTPRTIRLTWQPSAGATQYLVRYSLASPKGKEEGREVRGRGWRRQLGPMGWGARWTGANGVFPQVRVGQPEVLLGSLEPGRDYHIWVQSLQGAQASEARGIHARTRECPPPQSATHQWAEAFHGVGSLSGGPTGLAIAHASPIHSGELGGGGARDAAGP